MQNVPKWLETLEKNPVAFAERFLKVPDDTICIKELNMLLYCRQYQFSKTGRS